MHHECIRVEIDSEALLLSITKNCEKLIKQTHRKPQETPDFKLTQTRKTCSFKTVLILVLTLDDCINKFRSTQLQKKIINCTFIQIFLMSFHLQNWKMILQRFLVSQFFFLPKLLQHEVVGRRIIKAYEKLGSKKLGTDGYITFLLGCARSSIQDFESWLKNTVGLDERGFHIIWEQKNSSLITHGLLN